MEWSPGMSLEEAERQVIIAALRYHGGNRTHTAQSLKVAVRTVTNKLVKYKEQGHEVPAPPNGEPADRASKHD